ncbi:hypothetical protein D1007_17428 [Hordeum vulgare]|nr:hypothetical protein D1007_17428 [Hordeum vulgare]
MAAIHGGPQILEEHLAVEATIDTSGVDATTRLAALNDNSYCFLEAIVGAFEKDYRVFSRRAHAYLNSTASNLVLGEAFASQNYEEVTHDVEASPSSMSKESYIIDVSDDDE